jgi:hypothetical protein
MCLHMNPGARLHCGSLALRQGGGGGNRVGEGLRIGAQDAPTGAFALSDFRDRDSGLQSGGWNRAHSVGSGIVPVTVPCTSAFIGK